MVDAILIETLRDVDFLQGIDDRHLEQIASVARLVNIAAGKPIFREGDASQDVYLIIEGSVSLEICAPGIGCRRILTLGGGDLLGWSSVLAQSRLSATARALTATRAVQIPGSQIITLCEHNPRFGYEFMRRTALALAKRLNAARLQLLDVYGAENTATAEMTEE